MIGNDQNKNFLCFLLVIQGMCGNCTLVGIWKRLCLIFWSLQIRWPMYLLSIVMSMPCNKSQNLGLKH